MVTGSTSPHVEMNSTSDMQHHNTHPEVANGTLMSAEFYMERYAANFYEWVNGELIDLSPVARIHNKITRYCVHLLEAYFHFNPIGTYEDAPFVMRVDETDSRREPDLQVILNDNPGMLTDSAMIGAADICIEVVSEESVERDYKVKLTEYEKAGVREYWLFDPLRQTTRFLRLNDQKVYEEVQLDENGNYQTPLLPGLILHVPTLWQDPLPTNVEVVDAVRAMLAR